MISQSSNTSERPRSTQPRLPRPADEPGAPPDREMMRDSAFGLIRIPESTTASLGLGRRQVGLAGDAGQIRLRLGPPEEIFQKIIQAWEISEAAAVAILGLDGDDGSAYVRNVLRGITSIRRGDERKRIALLFNIYHLVHSLHRNRQVELAFLRTRQPGLDGSLLDLISNGKDISNLLKASAFMEALAGA